MSRSRYPKPLHRHPSAIRLPIDSICIPPLFPPGAPPRRDKTTRTATDYERTTRDQQRRNLVSLQRGQPLDVARPHLVLGWWLLGLSSTEQREERIPESFVAQSPHGSGQHTLSHHLPHLQA